MDLQQTAYRRHVLERFVMDEAKSALNSMVDNVENLCEGVVFGEAWQKSDRDSGTGSFWEVYSTRALTPDLTLHLR